VVGGRGAIVATVIALLLTFLIRLGAWKSLLIATVGGIAAAFALMALDIDLTRATAIWRFEDVLIWDATDPSMRLSLWTEAVQMWLRHPLWGAGTDAFIASRGDQIYVHNFILEILAEYGLLGLVLFLAPFIILIARRDRANAANNHLIILSIFFVVCFAFSGEIKDLAPLVFTMALVRA
jgi:O-antigen ligase